MDNGVREFRVLGDLPLCPKCMSHRKRIRFPLRIKVASAACLLFGAWGFWHSVVRAKGIFLFRRGVLAFQDDRYADAGDDLGKARECVPDEPYFEDLEAYFRGFHSLSEGNPKEAVCWFQKSYQVNPRSKETTRMLHVAERHAAFADKRYDEYFRTSEALLDADDRSPAAWLAMAPAWACRFAITGREECRIQALACLKEAHDAGGADADDWMVEGWVKQMLEKRSIISLSEYRYSIGKGGMSGEDFG